MRDLLIAWVANPYREIVFYINKQQKRIICSILKPFQDKEFTTDFKEKAHTINSSFSNQWSLSKTNKLPSESEKKIEFIVKCQK